MGGLVTGISVLSLASWVLLFALWQRNVNIQHRLAEPRLANIELLRLLANSYAAAKLVLEACPPGELPNRCALSRSRLSLLIARGVIRNHVSHILRGNDLRQNFRGG